jgi:hypothetical protein
MPYLPDMVITVSLDVFIILCDIHADVPAVVIMMRPDQDRVVALVL